MSPWIWAPSSIEETRRARLREVLAQHPIDPDDDDWVRDAIDAWYEHDAALTGLELWEYLGWDRDQHVRWVQAHSDPVLSPDAARWSPSLLPRMRLG